jgi:hypothetical protein
VPLSLPQERACGTDSFQLPETFLRSPPPDAIPVPERDDVDWDIDPDGFRFLRELNKGNKGYTGPEVSEEVFERVVDRFEKAVKADVLPLLPALETTLASIVPDVAAIKVAYGWWVQRRKQLAMPLIRELRPAPDPEDPDTTGVAFRPREKEGIRRLRSNNKKVRANASPSEPLIPLTALVCSPAHLPPVASSSHPLSLSDVQSDGSATRRVQEIAANCGADQAEGEDQARISQSQWGVHRGGPSHARQ